MNGRHEPRHPRSGSGDSAPATSARHSCPSCTITSETFATSPANRDRRRIAVGEEVTLTVAPGPATWSLSGAGSLSPSTGSVSSVTCTAGDTSGTVTITAAGRGCSCTISFEVVAPTHWTMQRAPGTGLRHTQGHPSCGWQGTPYVHPNGVNFYRVETRELDSLSVATGSFNNEIKDPRHRDVLLRILAAPPSR